MRLYAIDRDQIRALEQLRTRLHSETRMDGDEMRDAGHTLDAIVRAVLALELPEDLQS